MSSKRVFALIALCLASISGCGGSVGGDPIADLGDAQGDATQEQRDTGGPDRSVDSEPRDGRSDADASDSLEDAADAQDDAAADAREGAAADAHEGAADVVSADAIVEADSGPGTPDAGDADVAGGGGDVSVDAPSHPEDGSAEAGPVLISISTTPTMIELLAGTATRVRAMGVFSDASIRDVTEDVVWASDKTSFRVSNTAGWKGTVTARLGDDQATISATAGAVSGLAGAQTFRDEPDELEITPPIMYIHMGVPQEVVATMLWRTGRPLDVPATWSSADTNVATVGQTWSSSEFVTGVFLGTTRIQATSLSRTASASVQVSTAQLVGLAIGVSQLTLPAGTEEALTVMGTFNDADRRDLTRQAIWASSNPAVATVGTEGRVRALTTGTATVTAFFGGLTVSSSVFVSSATLQVIDITPHDPVVPFWSSYKLSALGRFGDGSTHDLTSLVTWTRDDEAIASTDAIGTTSVHASYLGVRGSTVVTVKEAYFQSVAISPAPVAMATNAMQALRAIASYAGPNAPAITVDQTDLATWSSTQRLVAWVSNVRDRRGTLTAWAAGTTTLGVRFLDRSASAELTVTPQPP